MSVSRIGLVFDNSARPETTGVYCRRALGRLAEVEHILPSELGRIAGSPAERARFDLWVCIDDGLRYRWPRRLWPAAYWAIDTHLDFPRSLSRARQFDVVFAAQRAGARRLQSHGINATWLPLACDPELHGRRDVPQQHDIAFVGNVFPGPRADLLALLQQAFPRTFVGRRYGAAMARTHSAARIVFNRSVADDLNMRVFEALASGALLVTNALPESGQEELFRPDRHLVTYRDADDLRARIAWYLEHESARQQIAAAGQAEVLHRHTYLHRMGTLLRTTWQELNGGKGPDVGPVSACLVSWKRPENMRRIVAHLRAESPWIDDIVIWNNAPGTRLDLAGFPDVTVIDSPHNVGTYGRWLAAQRARHPVIYTQDDDCLVDNLGELRAAFAPDPSRLVHNLKPTHVCCGEEPLRRARRALVGWGSLLPRPAIDAALQPYLSAWGEDELLHRKADRLCVLLQPVPPLVVPAVVRDLPGASGPEALSVRPDHRRLTALAVERAGQLARNRPPVIEVPGVSSSSRPVEATVMSDPTYFEHGRPEVMALVPTTAENILDVGCGAGRLGAALKQRQTCRVTGLEVDAAAADRAREVLDVVRTGDVEGDEGAFPEGPFDAVICADVLEHLRRPDRFLARVRKSLTPGGALIASIPNTRHHSVIRSLLAGNWTYEPAGLLDATHLRFFTRREIEKLLFRAGFTIDRWEVVPGPGHARWVDEGRPREVRIGGLTYRGRDTADAGELFAYQFLIRAVPRSRSSRPSIGERPAAIAGKDDNPDTETAVDRLRQDFPWPAERPPHDVPAEAAGWCGDGARAVLQSALSDDTRVVVELGSWLGLSTRLAAGWAPNATVIAIDHWRGSPEHHRRSEWGELLPRLYETFLAACWEHRDRIIPLRNTTTGGLRELARRGIRPDVIFVDADHAYDAVRGDLELCRELFPAATLIGDDYDDPGVARAVDGQAAAASGSVRTHGAGWRGWQLVLPAAVAAPDSGPAGEPVDDGLTSIVIVTHGQLALTRQCVASIRQLTDEPYELIVVDNGSPDGTADWLRQQADVRLIANPDNRGFPAAVNQGIAAATGRQVLLLNNDTLVTTGWLRRMLDALRSAPDIGLVGPVSNRVSGPQQIPVEYDEHSGLAELDGFAWDRGQRHAGQRRDVDRLVGFCLLIDRPVIERIGLLDERFGIGCYEDDDYCRRALAAGFRAVIAADAFVHHVGSATFRSTGVDFATVMHANRRKYDEKWSATESPATTAAPADPPPEAPATPRFELSPADGPGLRIAPADTTEPPLPLPDAPTPDTDAPAFRFPLSAFPPHLSLCMIVRDNESTIRPALESIRPWVDEMIVVDTGSTDATPEICRELGADVHHFAWCDDFSAARNESLRHARGEWIFWMDSDDTIPADCGRRLRELVDGPHAERTLGYVCQVHCPGDGPHEMTVVDHVKLFRNRPDLRFEHRIHEQILPAIRCGGGEVAFTDIHVVHSGSDRTVVGRQRKLERDYRLLELDLAERPDHPFVLFNLGMTHNDAGRHPEAIDTLTRCLQVSAPGESHVRKAYALLIGSLVAADRHTEAEACCVRGLDEFPDDPELLFRQATLHQHAGRLTDAESAYLRLLEAPGKRHFASIDAQLTGGKTRHNLALVYEAAGRLADAEAQWRRITATQPDWPPAWRGLGEVLLARGAEEELQSVADHLLATGNGVAHVGHLLLARRDEHRGQPHTALDRLRPHAAHPDILTELCRLAFEHQGPAAAEPFLRQRVTQVSTDAAAWHNLGTACIQRGLRSEAARCFRRSLELRPDSPPTRSALAALQEAHSDSPWADGPPTPTHADDRQPPSEPSGESTMTGTPDGAPCDTLQACESPSDAGGGSS